MGNEIHKGSESGFVFFPVEFVIKCSFFGTGFVFFLEFDNSSVDKTLRLKFRLSKRVTYTPSYKFCNWGIVNLSGNNSKRIG